ncbi:hypothetical protein HNQ80_001702 [Anaerosolibacter carboniphilus]|uniref:Copper amine oxidase-like N-terminal domain-containing protein n=1 Tax=Anaerosolibacter carboniphilus TaxID=1417629 RepID=A0A841KQB8_9FIRM|nr:copper amine oxidase N-terminal domain-containing protein [Anaerosolibacter carboniphilus]MBB6215613.1 hypothetical protein [Anaerosolibacter carboniphilus]
MVRGRKKITLSVSILCMVLLLFSSTGYADQVKKTVDAWYSNIKIVANGTEVAMSEEPFIVNGRTYVPVSAIANIFNKDIQWNGAESKVIINDKPDATVALLNARLNQKDLIIAELEKKVKDLEANGSRSSSKSGDLDDLEDQLNDDYGKYEDIKFKITLDGDEDDIEVEIYVDLDDYEDEWEDLSTSDVRSYLQDIVDDILDEFEDADIEGFIEDEDSGDTLVEFTVDSDGDVEVDFSDSNSDVDLDDLEDQLNDDYAEYFDDIKLAIELDGDEDDITFDVNFNYYKYEEEWDDLSTSKINTFMKKIYEDILDEFDDADIEGTVYDTYNKKTLGTYTKSSGYKAK